MWDSTANCAILFLDDTFPFQLGGIKDDDSDCNKARKVFVICVPSRGLAVDFSFRAPKPTANGRELMLMGGCLANRTIFFEDDPFPLQLGSSEVQNQTQFQPSDFQIIS